MGNISMEKLTAYLDDFNLFKDKRHRPIFNEAVYGILASCSLFPPQDDEANPARLFRRGLRR